MEQKNLSIIEYIVQFDVAIQLKLTTLRRIIQKTAPDSVEKIAWGVPTYYQNGFLVQFAANKKHIGFYCSPGAIKHFCVELAPFDTNEKNTIRLPLDKDLPEELLRQIILFRIKENEEKADMNQSKKDEREAK